MTIKTQIKWHKKSMTIVLCTKGYQEITKNLIKNINEIKLTKDNMIFHGNKI